MEVKERRALSKLSVLYVEDERIVRASVLPMLNKLFNVVFCSENGREGLQIYRENGPDIIITDIVMPCMDGLAMAEEIRKLDASVPIIVISAFTNSENLIRAVNIGVDGFVEKTFTEDDLSRPLLKLARLALQRKELEHTTQLLEEYKKVVDTGSAVLKVSPRGLIRFVNPTFCTLSGFSRVELIGKNIHSVFQTRGGRNVRSIFSMVRKKQVWRGTLEVETRQGSEISLDTLVVPIRNGQGRIAEFIALCQDITDFIRTKESLETEKERYKLLAITDSLTGIHNRQEFNNRFRQEIERLHRYGDPLSLIVFDIDHFKLVNDRWGHQAGDQILIAITQIVKRRIRRIDTLARIGGEEFAILMPSTELEQAGIVAEKLRFLIETSTSDHEYTSNIFMNVYSGTLGCTTNRPITCSFGVAQMKPNEPREVFFKRTDDALYEAKHRGRNQVVSSGSDGGFLLQSDLIRIFGEQVPKRTGR